MYIIKKTNNKKLKLNGLSFAKYLLCLYLTIFSSALFASLISPMLGYYDSFFFYASSFFICLTTLISIPLVSNNYFENPKVFKIYCVSLLVLLILTVLGILYEINYFSADFAMWTSYSMWDSFLAYLLLLFIILVIPSCFQFVGREKQSRSNDISILSWLIPYFLIMLVAGILGSLCFDLEYTGILACVVVSYFSYPITLVLEFIVTGIFRFIYNKCEVFYDEQAHQNSWIIILAFFSNCVLTNSLTGNGVKNLDGLSQVVFSYIITLLFFSVRSFMEKNKINQTLEIEESV